MSSAMAHPHHHQHPHQHQHQHHQHRQKKVLRAYILVRACRTDHKFVQRYHAEHISFATWRGEHRSTIELCIAPTSEVCVWYGLPSQSVFCSTFILTKKNHISHNRVDISRRCLSRLACRCSCSARFRPQAAPAPHNPTSPRSRERHAIWARLAASAIRLKSCRKCAVSEGPPAGRWPTWDVCCCREDILCCCICDGCDPK